MVEDCELFDCRYGNCKRVSKWGFKNRDTLNTHLFDIHWVDYCKQSDVKTIRLEYKLNVEATKCGGKTNVSKFGIFQQCVAQFFSPNNVKNIRYCMGKGRKRLFESSCFNLWREYELSRLFDPKKRTKGLTPKAFLTKYFGENGWENFKNVIMRGDYKRELKDNFEAFSGVNEPQNNRVRYYLFASKKLKLAYLGSTQQMLGYRINKHFLDGSVAVQILTSNDVEFTILGYVNTVADVKDIKQLLEYKLMDGLENETSVKFANICRNPSDGFRYKLN